MGLPGLLTLGLASLAGQLLLGLLGQFGLLAGGLLGLAGLLVRSPRSRRPCAGRPPALEEETAAGEGRRRRVVAGYNQDDCRASTLPGCGAEDPGITCIG